MAAHPWTGLYPKRIPMTMPVSHGSLIQEWTERVERAPDAPAVAYFDGLLGVRQVDDDSEASGSPRRAWHRTRRSGRGVPAEHPSIRPRLARAVEAWRHCARAEPYVPREELRRLIDDSGATGIICADADADETRTTLDGSTVRWTVSTSALADRQYPTQRAAHVRRRRPRHRRTPMSSTTCQRACHEHSCPLS